MPEPRRVDVSPAPDHHATRDSRAETLLVDGLDRYFDGRFEDAIHLWTRVLFFDRTHSRARAYIDRARTAIAEQQRRAEEMLETSRDLLDRGQTDAARHMLAEAVASSGDDERAAALRLRLERIERAHASRSTGRLPIVAAPDVIPGWSWKRRSPAMIVVTAATASTLIVLTSINPALFEWKGFGAASETLVAPTPPAPLPVLSISEAALVRARTLYARGRLAEALQSLNRVDDNSPVGPAATAMRVEIQRLLLAGSQERAASRLGARGVPR
jgi:tetratricopeptide (TPR) repeat protein